MSSAESGERIQSNKLKTSITNLLPGKILIRGYPLQELIGNINYGEMVYLCLKGELPSRNIAKMLNALLLAITDHGLVSAASLPARIVCAGNPDPIKGLCAGILSIGVITGSPKESARFINGAYRTMKEQRLSLEQAAEKIVDDYVANRKRLLGVGHPLFKDVDIRAARLREIAVQTGFIGDKLKLFELIHQKYLQKLGKKNLVINVDGMMAAIMCEMDFDEDMIDIIAVLSYLPGICAHTYEELKEKTGMGLVYQLAGIYEYAGPDERHLPKERLT
jgi:citryl-CoA lyase